MQELKLTATHVIVSWYDSYVELAGVARAAMVFRSSGKLHAFFFPLFRIMATPPRLHPWRDCVVVVYRVLTRENSWEYPPLLQGLH